MIEQPQLQRDPGHREYLQAASVGMTVEQFRQMKEDKEYRDEMKAIEEEERADEQAAERPVFQEKQSWSNVGDPSDPAFDDPFFNRNKIETPLSQSGAHGDYTGEQEAAFEGMYPDRYKDSVKKDESFGVGRDESGVGGREREIYADTAFGKMKVRSMENQAKIRSGEMTPDEAEEDYNAYRQGLIREINIEKAGPEFQGVGVMPPQEQPPEEAPPVEAPKEDFEGFMPPEAAAGEQADIQRDENDPVVKEMVEVQKNPEARKEVLKDVPKEEIAMVKEELGNYYIGPGGYAINLETVDADNQRGANFLMLQHVPVHARAQMLANWGYIDQEDVDNLPDSPTVQKAKIEAETDLAKQNLISETDLTKVDKTVAGTLNVTNAQIKAQKELNTSNNTLKRELALKDDEFRRLDLEDKNWRFMERQELEAYMHNNGIDLDEKKLAALQDHQLAQINLGYSKIRSVERVEANMLKFKDKQWSQKYTLATDQEKRAMLLQEHTKGMDVINMAMDNGQLDLAAVTALKMGVPFIPDYKAYMTAHAKASNTDPNVKAVLNKYFPNMKASVVAGQYATFKNGRMKHYASASSEPGMPSNLDNWISADPTRGNTWENMSAPEKEQYNSKDHWMAVKITEATNWDLRNSAYNQYHTVITNRTMPDIDTPTDSGADSGADADASTGADTGADAETTTDQQFSSVVSTPLADLENKIVDQQGYGFTRESKGPKKGVEKIRHSKADALKKSLKEGERLANRYLQDTMVGKKRKFTHMKQVIDYFRANPEELERRGSNQFKHYIITQIQKGTGTR